MIGEAGADTPSVVAERAADHALELADRWLAEPMLHRRHTRQDPAGVRRRLAESLKPGAAFRALLEAFADAGASERWILDGVVPAIVSPALAADVVETPLPSRAWLRRRARALERESGELAAAGFPMEERSRLAEAAEGLRRRARARRPAEPAGAPGQPSTRLGVTIDGSLRGFGIEPSHRLALVAGVLAALWPDEPIGSERWRQRLKDFRRRLSREVGVSTGDLETGGIELL